jgi:DNA-binding transcriptional ArsR family regulator
MNIRDLEAQAGQAAKLMKAMSNPHRLFVLCQLLDGERRVSELEEATGLSQSALSQHLARLRNDGIVVTRRQAQNIYYSLAGTDVHQVIGVLHQIFCNKPQTKTAARAANGGLPRATRPRREKRLG